ncbi:RDD family protein [Streptomyces sp. NPDC058307]|uniref:RDD family protein n=1 Tax=Streptomyces sp. NPDC058307 TaxID=3346439 RepID=UPI0036EC917A
MTDNPDEHRGTRVEQEARGEPRQWDQRPQHPPTTPPPFAPQPTPPTASAALTPLTECPACGKPAGEELSCQFCSQVLFLPQGIRLSTAGLRFGGYVLEFVLMICTLVIGWVIWALIAFQYGQTPAKQLLHMRVICIPQARTAGWLRMFFREVIAKTLIGFLASFTLLIPYFWLLWDKNRQELWDKMATTLVVSDPRDLLQPQPQPQLSDSRAGTPQR